jgi:hypothetical protein
VKLGFAALLALLLGAVAAPGQTPRGARLLEPAPPSPPAAEPPAPAVLPDAPLGPSSARPVPPTTLAPGLEALPEGGWRLRGAAARGAFDPALAAALAEIGSRLAELPAGRVTISAQVAGPANDPSTARRSSLAAARQARHALEAGGLPGTRIDLRPLGRTADAIDQIEVQPPSQRRRAGG